MMRGGLSRAIGWVTGGVAVVAVALGALLGVIRGELIHQVAELDEYITFTIGQGEVDLLRLVVTIGAHLDGDTAVTLDHVRERLDVLYSRAESMSAGKVRRIAATAPSYDRTVNGLKAFLAEADSVFAADEPDRASLERMAALGAALQPPLHDLTTEVNQRVSESRNELRLGVIREVEIMALGYLALVLVAVGGSFAVYRLFRDSQERRLLEITDAIPGGVFQFRESADGAVDFDFVNRWYAQVRGHGPDAAEAVGLRDGRRAPGDAPAGGALGPDAFLRGVVADDVAALCRALADLGERERAIDVEFRIDHPTRGRRWLNLRASGRREQGAVVSGVFFDITDRKEQEAALEEARRQAEEATKAKSSFLAMMSHEIRTPMNGVMTMAELLERTSLNVDQRGMTTIIRSSSAALLTIINDILDFSKIEAGRLEVESIPFDMAAAVEEVGELLVRRAEEKGLDLVVDVAPTLSGLTLGDPVRVRQILLNLTGNALKFTERGGVVVRAWGMGTGAGARLHVEVEDTGIGLTPEQRAKLFRPFQQAEESTSRRFGGTGLGLSIARRLCELMGGEIGCESAFGRGSRFWFELPARPAPPEAGDDEAPGVSDAEVVVVGAVDGHRRALANALEAVGVTRPVTWLVDDDDARPEAALRDLLAARDAGPASGTLVVFLFAPDSRASAPALAGRLTDDPTLAPVLADVRFALIGSRALASTLDEGMRRGMFATVTLPVARARLRRVLAAALGLATLEDREADDHLAWAPPSVAEARAAKLLVLVAEDNPTNRVVLGRLLDQQGYAYEMAVDGREGLAFWRERGGYGLLLTDFHMPEMDGFDLTRAIRAEEKVNRLARMPIVAVTADALPGTRQLCLDTGMDDYLSKPIDRAALTDALRRHLPGALALRRRAESASASRPASSPPSPASGPTARAAALPEIDPEIFELDRLAETFGAIDDDALDFVRGFLTTLPETVAGVEAALAEGDAAEARHRAHALKGAARSVGAKRLGFMAADVQNALDEGDADMAGILASMLEPTREELVAALAPLFGEG